MHARANEEEAIAVRSIATLRDALTPTHEPLTNSHSLARTWQKRIEVFELAGADTLGSSGNFTVVRG